MLELKNDLGFKYTNDPVLTFIELVLKFINDLIVKLINDFVPKFTSCSKL